MIKPIDEALAPGQTGYTYCSTQLDVRDAAYPRTARPPFPILRQMANRVPDGLLTGPGREGDLHLTVKYGLLPGQLNDVRDLLVGFGPVKAKLGKTRVFPAKSTDVARGGDAYDVVYVEVIAPKLRRLNALLAGGCRCAPSKFKRYVPHLTLAYVLPGRGRECAGWTDAVGCELEWDHLVYCAQDGRKARLSLVIPEAAPVGVAEAAPVGVAEAAGPDSVTSGKTGSRTRAADLPTTGPTQQEVEQDPSLAAPPPTFTPPPAPKTLPAAPVDAPAWGRPAPTHAGLSPQWRLGQASPMTVPGVGTGAVSGWIRPDVGSGTATVRHSPPSTDHENYKFDATHPAVAKAEVEHLGQGLLQHAPNGFRLRLNAPDPEVENPETADDHRIAAWHDWASRNGYVPSAIQPDPDAPEKSDPGWSAHRLNGPGRHIEFKRPQAPPGVDPLVYADYLEEHGGDPKVVDALRRLYRPLYGLSEGRRQRRGGLREADADSVTSGSTGGSSKPSTPRTPTWAGPRRTAVHFADYAAGHAAAAAAPGMSISPGDTTADVSHYDAPVGAGLRPTPGTDTPLPDRMTGQFQVHPKTGLRVSYPRVGLTWDWTVNNPHNAGVAAGVVGGVVAKHDPAVFTVHGPVLDPNEHHAAAMRHWAERNGYVLDHHSTTRPVDGPHSLVHSMRFVKTPGRPPGMDPMVWADYLEETGQDPELVDLIRERHRQDVSHLKLRADDARRAAAVGSFGDGGLTEGVQTALGILEGRV